MAILLALTTPTGDVQDVPVEVELVVGRAPDCGLVLDDKRLSRHHARFFFEGEALCVEDLGTPNGTFVNERRVQRTALTPGDRIALGKCTLRVVFNDAGASVSDTGPIRVGPMDLEVGEAAPELVKPVASQHEPSLERLGRDGYFNALGLGDETVLDASPKRLPALLRQTRNFAALHELSHALEGELDTRAMLGRALDLVLLVSRAERGYVLSLEDDGSPRLEAARPAPSPGGSRLPVSRTVLEHVLDRKCAVLCSDARLDRRFHDSPSLFLNETRSLLAAPMLVGSRVLGLIQIESSRREHRFTEEDLDLLSVMASTVGAAFENVSLLSKREAMIRELETTQARLVATQERLVAAERLAAIGRLATGVAHEVRNHLSPFMVAEMLKRRYPDDAELTESIEIMLEARQHILDLVGEIRAFVSGTPTKLEPELFDVVELVERIVRFVRCDAAIKRFPIDVLAEERPSVEADARAIRQVLINLLKNAADAMDERRGRIRIRISSNDRFVSIDVEDSGSGIAPELRERIFQPFFTTKGERGLGLGLDISRKIARDHGGELDFTSTPGVGTVFRLSLPRAD